MQFFPYEAKQPSLKLNSHIIQLFDFLPLNIALPDLAIWRVRYSYTSLLQLWIGPPSFLAVRLKVRKHLAERHLVDKKVTKLVCPPIG